MKSPMVLRLTVAAVAVGGALVSAQGQLLPSYPKLSFGASVSPAYDGWHDNADGTHTFLIGYYSRNWNEEIDIPIGANNKFEPGDPIVASPRTSAEPQLGHVYGDRAEELPANEHLWWTLTVNGVTSRVGMILSPDFNITPQKSSEEAPNGSATCRRSRLSQGGPAIQSPVATLASAISKTATVGEAMPLELFVDDDALYTSGTNAPMGRVPAIVTATVSKYRGPGNVKAEDFRFTTLKGGKPMEDWSGKANGKVTFDKAGDYVLHVLINDFSGRVAAQPAAAGPTR